MPQTKRRRTCQSGYKAKRTKNRTEYESRLNSEGPKQTRKLTPKPLTWSICTRCSASRLNVEPQNFCCGAKLPRPQHLTDLPKIPSGFTHIDIANPGRVLLPASFIGSPKYFAEKVADALAIVREFRKANFFRYYNV